MGLLETAFHWKFQRCTCTNGMLKNRNILILYVHVLHSDGPASQSNVAWCTAMGTTRQVWHPVHFFFDSPVHLLVQLKSNPTLFFFSKTTRDGCVRLVRRKYGSGWFLLFMEDFSHKILPIPLRTGQWQGQAYICFGVVTQSKSLNIVPALPTCICLLARKREASRMRKTPCMERGRLWHKPQGLGDPYSKL